MTGPDMWLGNTHITDESHTFKSEDVERLLVGFDPASDNPDLIIFRSTMADGIPRFERVSDQPAEWSAAAGFTMDEWQRKLWQKYANVRDEHGGTVGGMGTPPRRLPVQIRPGLLSAGRTSDHGGNVVHIVTPI